MMLRRKTDPKTGKHTLFEPTQSKCTCKMPDANPGSSILCELAQSICTWACHNRHFVQKNTGKMPDANPGASILCEPTQSKCTWTMDMSQEAFRAETYRKNAGRFRYHRG